MNDYKRQCGECGFRGRNIHKVLWDENDYGVKHFKDLCTKCMIRLGMAIPFGRTQ